MPGRHVENFATFVFCKDRILTNYFGVAYSKAFIAGKWQFAHQFGLTQVLKGLERLFLQEIQW